MTPFNEFVHSVQDSFAANRATSVTKLGLILLATVVVVAALSVWQRRRRSRRELAARVRAVVSAAGLSTADLDDLQRIATVGALPLIDVMTVLAQFEHATARLLSQEAPTIRPVPGSWFERVRHLRRVLGYSPLSAHLWLLTTRELVVGDSVAASGSNGQVVEVNEASFAVDWPATVVLVQGATLALIIDRPDDARYVSRVRVLNVGALPGTAADPGGRSLGQRAFLAHDEQPERQQDREYLRLRITAPVSIQVVSGAGPGAAPAGPLPAPRIDGAIVDVSAGGLSLNLPVSSAAGPITRGRQLLCWFVLDEQARFEALAAVVVAADPVKGLPSSPQQHLRLSFASLPDIDRDRLVAAVARHQAGAPPAAAGGKV